MNQTQYLSALKKALNGLDGETRKNILLEIEGLVSEVGPEESIEDRFGSPEQLAKQYLEGETIHPTVGKKVTSVSKKIFLWVGITITLLALGLAAFFWYFGQDKFDYADLNAEELNRKGVNWKSMDWSSEITIELDQARAIIYWHDEQSLDWNCGNGEGVKPVANEVIKLRHNECLIFLPKQAVSFSVNQADLVLVKPETSINIKLYQSKLRVAERGNKYKFDINAKQSSVDNFNSHDDSPLVLNVRAEESQIGLYKY